MTLSLAPLAVPAPAAAQIGLSISIGVPPPPLPFFDQPPLPGPGYIWTPGYWAWDRGCDCYYWVPGLWVLPPRIGWLWTPGYWYWRGDRYFFSRGYWGPSVGFYGGVDYGFGYNGVGYLGGEWRGRQFFYNRTVNNLGATRVASTFSRSVAPPVSRSRVSFNGGRGGLTARPTPGQMAIARAPHAQATTAQTQRANTAATNPSLRAGAVTKPGGASAVRAMEKASPTRQGPAAGPVNPRNPAAPPTRETRTMAPGGETGRPARERPHGAVPGIGSNQGRRERPNGAAPSANPNQGPGMMRERPSGQGEMRGHGMQARPEGMRQSPPASRPETPPPARSREPMSQAPEARPQGSPPSARQPMMQEAPAPQRDMMPGRQNQPPAHSRPSPDRSKPDQSQPDQSKPPPT